LSTANQPGLTSAVTGIQRDSTTAILHVTFWDFLVTGCSD